VITLSQTPTLWPAARILVAKTWGANSATSGTWEKLPMARRKKDAGFRLLKCSRVAMPLIGQCTFAYDFGRFATGTVGGADMAGVRDLRGYEIRVQIAERTDDNPDEQPTTGWATVWLGYCEYQQDDTDSAGSLPAGIRIYHCVDSLQRMKKWPLNRHGYYFSAEGESDLETFIPAAGAGDARYSTAPGGGVDGHPGYNVALVAKTAGNRDGSGNAEDLAYGYTNAGLGVIRHAPPGSQNATTWTDKQAIVHAIRSSRGQMEPDFAINDTAQCLSGVTVWPIKPQDTCLSFLTDVLDRRRGRGLAFLNWDDDGSAPDGPITVKISVYPQLLEDITITDPATGSTIQTIFGATSAVTTRTVDLIGDHRVVSADVAIRDQQVVDYLETVGERIEVMATARIGDGPGVTTAAPNKNQLLNRAWDKAAQTAFDAASTTTRQLKKYAAVYTKYRVNPGWSGVAYDGNSKNSAMVNYQLNDAGVITEVGGGRTSTVTNTTDPHLVEILSDLPIYEGYDYSTSTAKPPDTATSVGDPKRRGIILAVRTADDTYLEYQHDDSDRPEVSCDGSTISVCFPNDAKYGTRYLGNPTASNLGSAYSYIDLTMTLSFLLPHRVRRASGDPAGRRKRRIFLQDMHLWLAAPNAIWTLSDAGVPSRNCLTQTTNPAILRDDRGKLAARHELAWKWYGPATTRRTGSWTIRCCGFLSSFSAFRHDSDKPADFEGTPISITYPKIGEFITTYGYAGQSGATMNSPVTSVEYDHETGETTWTTDWVDLDYAGT